LLHNVIGWCIGYDVCREEKIKEKNFEIIELHAIGEENLKNWYIRHGYEVRSYTENKKYNIKSYIMRKYIE